VPTSLGRQRQASGIEVLSDFLSTWLKDQVAS
jgi:hypothetical protein